MLGSKFKKNLGSSIESVGVLIGLSAVCVFGYQIYFWLRTGFWMHIPLGVALTPFAETAFIYWLMDPQEWLGLHKVVFWIIVNIPLALVIFVVAVPIVVWGQNIKDEAEHDIKSPKEDDDKYEE